MAVWGFDGCRVLMAAGTRWLYPPSGPREAGWLLGPEWEGSRKGKELRMGRIGGSAYLPCGVSPRKGRAGHSAGRHSRLAPQGGARSRPPRHPSHRLPVRSQKGMKAPNWDPGR